MDERMESLLGNEQTQKPVNSYVEDARPDAAEMRDEDVKELTWFSVSLAVGLGIVMHTANVYVGLFSGFPISASIPCVIVSMGIQRSRGQRSNPLEHNIVQTGASSASIVGGSLLVTVPSLLLSGYWPDVNYFTTACIGVIGGITGVLFAIPLRRALILKANLCFPEGVAAAEVLKIGNSGGSETTDVLKAALLGALCKLGESGLKIWNFSVRGAFLAGNTVLYGGYATSPSLIAIGYIIKAEIATIVGLGGMIAWWMCLPIVGDGKGDDAKRWDKHADEYEALKFANYVFEKYVRYIGVGVILVGAGVSLLTLRKALVDGVKSAIYSYRHRNDANASRTEQDMPLNHIGGLFALCTAGCIALISAFSGEVGIGFGMGIFAMTIGFLFAAAAAYMAGSIGSSNSPVSGISLATCVASSAILSGVGMDAKMGSATALLVVSILTALSAMAGDTMQDLKTGVMVHCTPSKLQHMQLLGAFLPAFLFPVVLQLMNDAYGIGPATTKHPNSLPAPQAQVLAEVARGVFTGDIPWDYVGYGSAMGAGFIVLELCLGLQKVVALVGREIKVPVLALATGMYLPIDYTLPIFFGGLISFVAERVFRKKTSDIHLIESQERMGVLISSGLITGEALMGILLAIPIVVSQDTNIMRTGPESIWGGLIPSCMVGTVLYLVGVGFIGKKSDVLALADQEY